MAVLHVVLIRLPRVPLAAMGQEIRHNGFLQPQIPGVLLVPQHRGFDTSTSLHPYPVNEGVKRGEGGVKLEKGVKLCYSVLHF